MYVTLVNKSNLCLIVCNPSSARRMHKRADLALAAGGLSRLGAGNGSSNVRPAGTQFDARY